jgi:trigger factor
VDQIGKNKVRLDVEVPLDDVAKLVDRTYRKLAGQVKIPGFRPGKAPKAVLDQRLGKDFVRQEALREALPELFAQAVDTESLDVVAPPELEVTSFEDGADLTFSAVVEVRPTPELKDYSGLEVERPSTEVTDDEVAEQIERLRVRYATLEVVPRPARKGDFVLMDLKTYRHDVTIEELTAKDLHIEVGAEMVVAELDSELEGKRAGDIFRFTTTLPERFGERAEWQVGMQVLVKEVKARNLPALDDELAKTVSEFDTLDELRGDIRDRLEKMKEAQADATVRERVLDVFVSKGVEIELPDGMIEVEVDRLVTRMARMMAAQGLSIEQYMESEKLDVDALRQRLRPQAERNLTLTLGLKAVADVEGLEASEEDRNKEIEDLARMSGREVEEVRKSVQDQSLDGDIITSKALDLLVARANITQEGGSA